jgi:hypothetical protein
VLLRRDWGKPRITSATIPAGFLTKWDGLVSAIWNRSVYTSFRSVSSNKRFKIQCRVFIKYYPHWTLSLNINCNTTNIICIKGVYVCVTVAVRSEAWVLSGWLLGSWIRIPLKAWMFVRVFLCCVVLCRLRPCDGLITRPRSPTICLNRSRNLYVRWPRLFKDCKATVKKSVCNFVFEAFGRGKWILKCRLLNRHEYGGNKTWSVLICHYERYHTYLDNIQCPR